MSSQVTSSALAGRAMRGAAAAEPRNFARRAVLFAVFFACGLAVFVFGGNYFALFPTNHNSVYQTGLTAAFLIAAVVLQRQERFKPYAQVALAFCVASAPFLVTTFFGELSVAALRFFNVTTAAPAGMAVAKTSEALLVVATILVLTRLSGAGLGSLYLQRGNLKWWLIVGAAFLVNYLSSAFLFFAGRYATPDRLLAATGWGIVFSCANGFMEELWFRGLFLKRLEPLLGSASAVLLTSIVFALAHVGAVYVSPAAIPFMLGTTFTLGLAMGAVTLKTDSLWGAVLMHVAGDVFLFIAMLAS